MNSGDRALIAALSHTTLSHALRAGTVPFVRRLLPVQDDGATRKPAAGPPAGDVDVDALVAADKRTAAADRPWVLVNMIASLDGAFFGPDGRSGQLSDSADRQMFRSLRGIADVILAGATTVRVENYGAPRLSADAQAARRERGQAPLPRMATVSASLRLDPTARLFSEAPPDQPPIVLTTQEALKALQTENPDLAASLADVAELRAYGQDALDWARALQEFRREARVVLLEGGPTVNAQLIAGDLVDEFCLTLSPSVVVRSGVGGPVAGAAGTTLRRFRLNRVLEQDDFLFLRYLRAE